MSQAETAAQKEINKLHANYGRLLSNIASVVNVDIKITEKPKTATSFANKALDMLRNPPKMMTATEVIQRRDEAFKS